MVDSALLNLISENFIFSAGRFYGSARGLALGAGVFYRNVRYPLFNGDDRCYDTVEGDVLVLTHECDVDAGNARILNEFALVLPLIKPAELVDVYRDRLGPDRMREFLVALAKNDVSRAFLFPPGAYPGLEYGAIGNLNTICPAHIGEFGGGGEGVCALSEYSQQIFDYKILNHLLRMKSETLPRLN